MVDDARTPAALDLLAGGRNAAPRLAGHDQHPHGAVRQRRPGAPPLPGHLDQAQGVGRRAADDGRAHDVDQRQARLARHPAGGHAVGAELGPGVERGPEAEERTEGEGEQDPVVRPDPRPAVHRPPAVEHPLPALRRVQPPQGAPRRRRGLVVARVALYRIGERGPPRRRRVLVRDELRLGGQGQPGEVPRQDEIGRRDPGAPQPGRVERVAPVDGEQQPPQALGLLRGERRPGLAFGRGDRLGGTGHEASVPVSPPLAAPRRRTMSGGMSTAASGWPACRRTQAMVRLPLAIVSPSLVTSAA